MFDSLWPHGLQHETSLSFTISQSLLKFMSIESAMLSNHLILCCLLLLLPSIFAPSGSFPMSPCFASGGQSIRASVSSSIRPMKIQGWYPLGLTSLISLLSKGISKVFSRTTIWKHQFFSLFMVQLSHPYMTFGKTIALTSWTFIGKMMSLLFICCLGLS